MADQPGQERTELATSRKREKAREKGQVAQSRELSSFLIMLSGMLALAFLTPKLGREICGIMHGSINAAFSVSVEQGTLPYLGEYWVTAGLRMLLPLFGILLAVSLGANLAQVGINFNGALLAPKAERVSPLAGLKRIFSKRSSFEFVKSLMKLGMLATITWVTLKGKLPEILAMSEMEILPALSTIGMIMANLAGRLILMMVVLALADYAFQRWQFEQEIMMTKQELKDEYKETEGDPLIKSRLRALQREIATQRMMEDVKRADVVVTNPTHYAVAIKYEDGMGAPTVLGKGKNEVARRIREIAHECKIPVIENRTLARALYAEVKVGKTIPMKFFQAVAELLAYVYRIREGSRQWS